MIVVFDFVRLYKTEEYYEMMEKAFLDHMALNVSPD